MKTWILLVLLLSSIGSTAFGFRPDTAVSPAAFENQVCLIQSIDNAGKIQTGTGTFINGKTLVTCEHCTKPGDRLNIRCPDPKLPGSAIFMKMEVSETNFRGPTENHVSADIVSVQVDPQFTDLIERKVDPQFKSIDIIASAEDQRLNSRDTLSCFAVGHGSGTDQALTAANSVKLIPVNSLTPKSSTLKRGFLKVLEYILSQESDVNLAQFIRDQAFNSVNSGEVVSGDSGGPTFCKAPGSDTYFLYGVIGGSDAKEVQVYPTYALSLEQKGSEQQLTGAVRMTEATSQAALLAEDQGTEPSRPANDPAAKSQ